MARSEGQKLKLLYIVRMLEDESDEQHPLSTQYIIERLEKLGIRAERKSIYNDMEKLTDFGYDIIQVRSRYGGGYYLAEREFELPELKLLVDAVQSSRFITAKKSRNLIKKLEKKAGLYAAGKLQRQVYVAGRVKTENESIYYNIDTIHRAIQDNKKISFEYLAWNLKKELVSYDNKQRIVSPWALIWKEENYYLAAYDSDSHIIKHFRVDKMGKVEVLDIPREGLEKYSEKDLADYTNQTFGMFAGEEETVSLICSNRLIGVVMDRFGKDADIRPIDELRFQVRVKVCVSGQFFGWLAGIGKDISISSPQNIKTQYVDWLNCILERQKQN
ncbi:MAG: WYL domain-containing protein [Acetatifactor sp.]|nr:WYL domain-containing protein [Acetatifactor sp.]